MSSSKGRSKATLWLMAAAFVLPVVGAALALNLGWYQGGSTNNGQLLAGVSYQQLSHPNPATNQWQIVTFVPADCDQACQQHLHQLNQAHIALGRDQNRVMAIAFGSGSASLPERFTHVASTELKAPLAPYGMVVVDPWGQWVMGYQIGQAREMVLDLRKLLKLSRIG